MKIVKMRQHARATSHTEMTWEQWREKWFSISNVQEQISHLHRVFSVKLPAAPGAERRANFLPHPDTLTARYRFLLHIADASTNYHMSVRKKAFEMLFGGNNMGIDGLFPQKWEVCRKELSTLFWFLRQDISTRGGVWKPENQELLMSVHQKTADSFWKNLENTMRRIYREGRLHFSDRYPRVIEVGSHTQRTVALNVLLLCHSASFIKHDIWRDVKRSSAYNGYASNRGTPDGCISLEDIEKMEKRLEQYCPPDALAAIALRTPRESRPLFADGLSTGDENALFLLWVEEFRGKILPQERAKTEAAIAERAAEQRAQRIAELERDRRDAEAELQALSEHDD